MDKWVSMGSVVGKEVLNLDDGTFVGQAQNVLIYPAEQKISGILLKQKRLLNNKNMVRLEDIQAFGSHTITLKNLRNIASTDGIDILNRPVVTIDGTVLGKVVDFTFDALNGQIKEYALAEYNAEKRVINQGVLRGELVKTIGREVIIAQENISLNDLYNTEEKPYQNWQEIDEIIAEVQDLEENLEGSSKEFTERINETIDSLEEKLQNISTKDLWPGFKEQAEKFISEAKNLFRGLKDKVSVDKIGLTDLREDWQAKFAVKNTTDDLFAEDSEALLMQQIEEQLQGSTVQKPVMDAEGHVIIWPGQAVNQEKIKAAVTAGKLQDIIDLIVPLEENSFCPKKTDVDDRIDTEKEKNKEEIGLQ